MRQNFKELGLDEANFNTIPFGPCAIDAKAWERLKLIVKTSDVSTGLCFALLGKIKGNSIVITDLIELSALCCNFRYTADQIRKIEKEAAKQGLMFVGMLYTHKDSIPTPLEHELAYWISLMFKLDRPLLYFVISTESSKIAAYTIPPEIFVQLKDAIKLVTFEKC